MEYHSNDPKLAKWLYYEFFSYCEYQYQRYQTTLPASWETCMQVKKQQLEPDMEQQTVSKLRKDYLKTILLPCLFNLYAEYIMRNARLEEAHAGIKIARRKISNLRYENDTSLIT